MPEADAISGAPGRGRLAENILTFCRLLRASGLSLGPGSVLDAVSAVEVAGIGGRADLYWTLHAVLVSRHEDHEVFDTVFQRFWRRRAGAERLIEMLSPVAVPMAPPAAKPGLRRVEEAFEGALAPPQEPPGEMEVDARFTASDTDVLRTRDFAQMSADELAEARRRIALLKMPDDRARIRRLAADPRGPRLDLRASIRASLSTGGDYVPLRRRGPRERPPPVVALVDISGSMSDYARPVLHFLHALGTRRRVETFLFGTRLTNVSRALRHRDPDAALTEVGRVAPDWSGGTRIATSLHLFNRDWSRRVLAQNPVVLLVTDGLERDADDTLAREMDRLQRSCRRLVWLNPLLRYAGFEPKARGIRAMLPHVDEFRPVHDLASLEALVAALSGPSVPVLRRGRAYGLEAVI
ncbi:VWA domain-containing protein [Azorhizobium oxalatiphilum]|uniref:VWA domain-containing protein n=1 Tax=Azorhizobium oxalatiphilum TaxID=980631 RepID=A0A917FEC1_9HYPH|nr:VWA domain-containing protein [Azorhizobium oxalatiphilum]GGF69672.1 VWA domain-containing protein [Azorhizobium oxalatiphilum]